MVIIFNQNYYIYNSNYKFNNYEEVLFVDNFNWDI